MEITKVLGTVAMVPKGEYDAEEYYEYLNVVTYNGSSYMARKSSHGVLPTDEEYWQLVAQKGARTYQSVADMKSDDDLKEGMVAETLGYSEASDGGNAKYIIVDDETITTDDWSSISLDNGLIAVLVIEDGKINVSKFGITEGTVTASQISKLNNFIAANPYCAIEFGRGTYELQNPIELLQGSTLCGIGNDTKLKPASGKWTIICKGLSTLNSTTEIYNLTIDGNFVGNGIYIDGTRYSRCEIHDLFITSCIYGIRNAKPTTADVYDNNYQVGSGGNNLHDLYITGETPNDDTSRCIDGLVLYANDNFITNVRVSGFGNYGVLLNGSGNQFTMLKTAVNHIGFRCNGGGQNFGTICAEESFQNNFELRYVRNSTLDLKTSAAGCVVANSLPTQLQYYDVYMENCSNNHINICGFVAQSFTYRKSGEKAVLNLQDCLLNDIKINFGNSEVPNAYCLPLISNCAFINSVKINTNNYDEFISYDIIDNITPTQAGSTVLSGTYPNLHVVNNGTASQQNLFALNLLDYIDEDLIIAEKSFGSYPPQVYQITYKFTQESSAHNYTSSSQFISSYGQNGSIIFSLNIKSILETQADYNTGIANGYTLQYVRLFMRCTHPKQGESDHEVFVVRDSE